MIAGDFKNVFLFLGLLGFVLWFLFAFLVPYCAIVSEQKMETVFPVSGAWLLLAVATQVTVFLSNYSALLGGIEGESLPSVFICIFSLGSFTLLF